MQQTQAVSRPSYPLGPSAGLSGPPASVGPMGPPMGSQGSLGPPTRGPIPTTNAMYGAVTGQHVPSGPPNTSMKPAQIDPPNIGTLGPTPLGPPISGTSNGHAPPGSSAFSTANGMSAQGFQPAGQLPGPPVSFTQQSQPHVQQNHPQGHSGSTNAQGPPMGLQQPQYRAQAPPHQMAGVPPIQSSANIPLTGVPPTSFRPGAPQTNIPPSMGLAVSNGPTLSGGRPPLPPMPGVGGGPHANFQQTQPTQQPSNDMRQHPGRPPMMPPNVQGNMPPFPPSSSSRTGSVPPSMIGQGDSMNRYGAPFQSQSGPMPPPMPGGFPPPGVPPTGAAMGGPSNYPPAPPGMNAAGPMGPGMPSGNSNRPRTLDPDQMPSPIVVMDEDERANGGNFDTKEKGQTPPLVTTKFTVRDYGNASPRYIRSTMYHVPSTEDVRKQTGVPFGLVISPLARIQEGESEPPVSDFGPTGPVRCMRCKAYMCAMMQFIDGGRRFQCVFCKATSEVPGDYFQHLDHQGQRLDKFQRPELCRGTYECLATTDYCRDSKPPQPPGIIFAIDVSYPMIKEGVVQLICANMKQMLRENLPRDKDCDQSKTRVGFMTYDSKINFYNINGAKLSQPQQMTVGDVHDMFVPLADGLFTSLDESEAVIDSLMEQIPQMFADTRETETVLGPVIQAGKEAFKAAECAGKLIVFHHNLPVAEAPGKLKNRDDRKVLGTEKEKAVLTPQTKEYNKFGQECVEVGCSVDLFLFNNAYIDVATLSQVSRMTGGQVYKYTYFQRETDGKRFLHDLASDLSRPIVYDAIMRVRTSTGVRPVEFYGSFYMANTTDTELASLNSDSAIACEIKYDDKLTDEDGVYIQAALLFTSCAGERRLRIINLALSCGNSMADMYRNCELDTIVNFTAKQSIARLMENNPKTVKENMVANCAQILASYRKNCASPSSAGQLILPECMKLLPLYTNCLLKSDALSGGADVGCDDRAFLMSTVSSMDVGATVAFFYPRLLPLHDISTTEEHITEVPAPVRCTIEKINENGVYLLDNGIYLFLYVGLAADPAFVQDVFGVSTAAQINIDMTQLEERDNVLSKKVQNIVDIVRGQRTRQYMRLVVVRQKDKLDILFRHYLCEDRASQGTSASSSDSNFSYVDFLCHMHKEIRALLG